MTSFRPLLRCALFLAAVPGSVRAQERPDVAWIVPAAVRAAHWQEIRVQWRNLQSVTGLLADSPLETTLLYRSAERAAFRVKPPKNAWLGIHQLRALTAESVSMPRLFVVDELPLVRQRAGN